MDAASNAGHVVEPASEMHFWASATGSVANKLRRRTLPKAGLCDELLIAWRVSHLDMVVFVEDVVSSKLIVCTASSVADNVRCRERFDTL